MCLHVLFIQRSLHFFSKSFHFLFLFFFYFILYLQDGWETKFIKQRRHCFHANVVEMLTITTVWLESYFKFSSSSCILLVQSDCRARQLNWPNSCNRLQLRDLRVGLWWVSIRVKSTAERPVIRIYYSKYQGYSKI